MKKLALVLALTLVAFVGTASASDWFTNNIGIYFDEAATSNCGTMAPLTNTPAYLVFTDLTATSVKNWEVLLGYNNVFLMNLTPRHNHVLVAPRPGETMVGLSEPQPVVGGSFVAADLLLFAPNTNVAGITANGVFFHLLSDRVPAYIDGNGVGYELHPVSGGTGSPIMIINDGCAVGTETSSFGELKSLFR